jgi:putative tricarboxylic transport membrane protein
MMGVLDCIWLGILAVFRGPVFFTVLGMPIPVTIVMVVCGCLRFFLLGIAVGATPGLAGPMAMAISLPILISVFGYSADALLPVMGFLIGIMKGATIGGAVPAILFNTPGTPDAFMTTLNGYPMAQNGQAGKALRVAQFSDLVLFIGAPFLAVMVEAYLDLPEKTALLILLLSFIAAVIGGSPGKGLISTRLGLFAAYVGAGEDFYPRLSFGTPQLVQGFSVTTAVLGVLTLGPVFKGMQKLWQERRMTDEFAAPRDVGDQQLHFADIRRLAPYIVRSAIVSGANLIPVLSLGIPGNAAAVFLILAAESIGGFNPGPSVFRFTTDTINPELVVAFGLFTTMFIGNMLNWTIGGLFMRSMGVMIRVPKHILLPVVLLLTLTAIYVQETQKEALWFGLAFGVMGFFMRSLAISPLPFVIAFILGEKLEETARQAFAATGGDPFFLFTHPVALAFMLASIGVIFFTAQKPKAN